MAYTQRLTVRFEDVDFARVVYFPRLFAYCHNVFEDFFGVEAGLPYARMLQERKVGFPARHADADFKAPLRFGDVCRVVMETLSVGERSINTRFRLYLGESDRLCAEVKVTQVTINTDTFTAVPVPEDVKQLFHRHLARD